MWFFTPRVEFEVQARSCDDLSTSVCGWDCSCFLNVLDDIYVNILLLNVRLQMVSSVSM